MANEWAYREVLLGITGKDFTIVAASKAAVRGITILKATDDKTRVLNSHTLMAYSGEAGDTGKQHRSFGCVGGGGGMRGTPLLEMWLDLGLTLDVRHV